MLLLMAICSSRSVGRPPSQSASQSESGYLQVDTVNARKPVEHLNDHRGILQRYVFISRFCRIMLVLLQKTLKD